MNTTETTDPSLPDGPFVGREAFRQRVRDALGQASSAGWRELVLCDARFDDWPLGERGVVDALTHWVLHGAGQRLTLLAVSYDAMAREHPLFVRWRQQWAHKVEARQLGAQDEDDLPSALWTPDWALERLDRLRHSGLSGSEPERRQLLRQNLDEWQHRSSPGFPATTLGL